MKRLVESWIEAERDRGNTLAAAIRRLNERCGMHVTHSRVSEWRNGVYMPSQLVMSYMLHRSLRWLLTSADVSISASQYQAIVSLLWDTLDEDGQSYVELV